MSTEAFDDATVLDAGGIVPGQSTVRAGSGVMTAREYRHPALETDEVVVRLVPAALGEAEDLAMEFLGFSAPPDPYPVGVGASPALGFPAWALVNDPGNGRHALAMVKEMERLARLTKTKPGNAKEGYEQLAARLDGTVPHFLPTFWEQAGRAFVAADNAKTAGLCFGRAREAERVHALAVDEQRVADVYIEYALAGALPAKAMSQYARELAERLAPEPAYHRFRSVAVHRVAGGLGPYAGMAEDLARLARAAGLDAGVEAQRVIADVLVLPAVARAPLGFWKSYLKPLVVLARQDPATRGRLLAILPEPPGSDADITGFWVELLDATGAMDGLTGDVEPDAAPPGGPAAWLERVVIRRSRGYRMRRSAPLLALVRRMAPRLVAEGRTVRPYDERVWYADLDLLDALVADGVPVAWPELGRLDIFHWLVDDGDGRRDLVALARYEPLAALWRRELQHAVNGRRGSGAMADHIAAMATHPGLRLGMADWLADAADRAGDATLAVLSGLADDLDLMHSSQGAAIAPDAVRRIAAADVSEALARTLRAGLVEELSWPAYDEAVRQLPERSQLQFDEAWPHLVVHDNSHALVVGAETILLDHVMQLPHSASRPGWRRPTCTYVDGRLQVTWHDHTGWYGYWAERPAEVFDVRAESGSPQTLLTALSIPLPNGGATGGGRPFVAGGRTEFSRHRVASDGTGYWRLENELARGWQPGPWRWREYTVGTGAAHGYELPRFFAEAPGELAPEACVLLPCFDISGSPLGQTADLVGHRVFVEPDGAMVAEGVDGRRVRLRPGAKEVLAGALTMPGDDVPRPLTIQRGGAWVSVHEPGTGLVASRSRPGASVPPLPWWHRIRPRDPAGSAALRSVSVTTVRAMLDRCPDGESDEALPGAIEAVATVLPAVTDETLRRAVALELLTATRCARWYRDFDGYADEAPPESVPTVPDDDVLAVVTDLLHRGTTYHPRWRPTASGAVLLPTITAVAKALYGAEPHTVRPSTVDWPALLGTEAVLALRAVSPAFGPEERFTALSLLDVLHQARLTVRDGTVRVLGVSGPSGQVPKPGTVLRSPDRTIVVTGPVNRRYGVVHDELVRAVEHCPGADFGPIEDLAIEEDRRPGGRAEARFLTAFLRLVAEHGPVPWRPESVDRLVELTGIGHAEAALLLAGLPGMASWEANFLDKPVRDLLGISAADARVARDALRAVPAEYRIALLDAALPDDPGELWRTGPDVDRLAAAWNAVFGPRLAVSEELLAEASRLVRRRESAEVVRGLANPATCAWLAPDGLTPARLVPATVILLWLAYRLPVGDPVRAAIPMAWQRIHDALRSPDYGLDVWSTHPNLPTSAALTLTEQRPSGTSYRLVPSGLHGPDDATLRLFPGNPTVTALGVLLSSAVRDLVADLGSETQPAGTYPHDPRHSTPDLVTAVVERYGVGIDAAAYYLQILALPDPTDRAVQRWTGWSAPVLKRLRAELVAAGLVVDAQRDRAGRTVFLPGGWLPLKAPNLPIERWKAELYGFADSDAPPLPVLVMVEPVARLFARAWARVVAGDEPKLRALS